MSQTIEVTLQIRDSQRDPTTAQLDVETFSTGQRAGRALVRLGALWVLAVGSVLIPLLHFVLVPGFALLGPVLAFFAFQPTVKVTSKSVTCPKCAQTSTVEDGATGWPVTLRCSQCSTTFFASPSLAKQ